MSDIKFYIPEGQTIPTGLELRVDDDISVTYRRNESGFVFYVWYEDINKAVEIVNEIVAKIKSEHDDPKHSVTWKTTSIKVVKVDPRYEVVCV